MAMTPDEQDRPLRRRVLVVAPEGRDASVISQVLTSHGMLAEARANIVDLVDGLRAGADAAFITEEALQSEPAPLVEWIAQQPPWSDFPFVVLVARRHGRRPSESLDALIRLGNIVLLERPLNAETLITGARAALRARARQYEAREQLLAEAELRRAEQAARMTAAEAGHALAVGVDAGELGTFHCPLPLSRIECSARCREHFQLPAQGPLDLPTLLRVIHKDDARKVREAFFDGSAQSDSREVELRTVAPDGSVRWVRAKGRIYRNAAGVPTRFDGVTLDVTAQKLLERERESLLQAEREARREAERAGRVKDEFISTLSHELRTPLSAILGWTYILRRGGASADVAKAADTIERNARAQAHLIEDLLDVSRIASGNIRLDLQAVSVVAVFEAVQQTLRPSFEAKQVDVSIDADSWRGQIQADAGRLQQIVWNIVSNAIKFTPDGGRVRIRSDLDGEHVVVRVSDTGDGIAPSFLPHVFDRFRQAESSEARTYGGLGLGLAIVRQLVEMHGGSVEAASPGRGQGATFVVRLPIGRLGASTVRDEAPAEAGVREPRQGVLDGLRVLVVDDEEDGREMLAILLRSHGASVATAESAEDALASLGSQSSELLISDIGMPNADGYQLLRSIRSSNAPWSEIPAIALTAFARAEDAAKARAAGFHAHLAKPVEPVRLVSSITALVGQGKTPPSKSAPH
jgi:signal transduction histidine kinase/ActR/RegA family two-component response regulator